MSRIPRKRPIDYILPFLIMVCAGVIAVLAYQLWSTLNTNETESDIYMYLAQGNAKMLPWGAGEWERAYNGTRILQGDSVKTQSGGRLVIELFGDHFVRLDERTEITFNEIAYKDGIYGIDIILSEGNIWLNSDEDSEIPVKFTIATNHTIVKTISTIYSVEQASDEQAIRVIEGNLLADILIEENGKKRKVETIAIGVGQEALITDNDLNEYAQRKSPSVISALSDKFRESSFYRWNMSEDNNPTDYSIKSNGFDSSVFDDNEATPDVEIDLEGELAAPVITVPSTLTFETPEDSLTIRGTTVAETNSIMVDVTANSETQTYNLNLYVPGNTQWSFPISKSGGTMYPGTNIYEFYAVGKDDVQSSKEKLTIIYKSDEIEEEEEELDLGPLTTPEANTFNDTTSNVVETDTVVVVGSVSGAKDIIVNGYTLSMFNPGDETWTYYAKESLGNLNPGENTYTVEAVSPDGVKKQSSFSITYNKPEEEEADDTEEEGTSIVEESVEENVEDEISPEEEGSLTEEEEIVEEEASDVNETATQVEEETGPVTDSNDEETPPTDA